MGTLPASVVGRTVDHTLIGIFWGYDGAAELGTPPRFYNQIVRRIAIQRKNSVGDNARLFAFLNVALADAGILCWDQKYIHNFWRPVLGVREHDRSMGAAAQANNDINDECDPLWLPLGAPATNSANQNFTQTQPEFPNNQALLGRMKNFTPPFPAYPSGHATFGAAALHITRLFYGVPPGDRGPDHLFDGLDIVSDELNGVNRDNRGTVRPRHVRSFPRGLWQMIEENGRSRVYLGVHWVFDAFAVKSDGTPDLARTDVSGSKGKMFGGVPLGIKIAEGIYGVNKKAPAKSPVGPRTP